ncbi:transposase (fragment) [Xenorhabdus bovienii str. Jollieti]|uniref:Transposase n=1 Tax=Xenorhabdus bovienii (strain SS-2004) TaxID=406818 RepID=D3UYE1_XENBS
MCHYLNGTLRRKVNEELNVAKQWNGVTNFVFFARRGEMTSNPREAH